MGGLVEEDLMSRTLPFTPLVTLTSTLTFSRDDCCSEATRTLILQQGGWLDTRAALLLRMQPNRRWDRVHDPSLALRRVKWCRFWQHVGA